MPADTAGVPNIGMGMFIKYACAGVLSTRDQALGIRVAMQVIKAALRETARINEARARRGLKPRPVRAVVVGFPNVGKSALINRLLGRRLCESAARPGVTRTLKWLRIGGLLDLLDSPGIVGGLHFEAACKAKQRTHAWAANGRLEVHFPSKCPCLCVMLGSKMT